MLARADEDALAAALLSVVEGPLLAQRLRRAALAEVRERTWETALGRLAAGYVWRCTSTRLGRPGASHSTRGRRVGHASSSRRSTTGLDRVAAGYVPGGYAQAPLVQI
jgi:hypothetical protein